jgi:hypothetical protein
MHCAVAWGCIIPSVLANATIFGREEAPDNGRRLGGEDSGETRIETPVG